MNEVGSLQIGHTSIKENDFKIECEVVNDRHVEVSFLTGMLKCHSRTAIFSMPSIGCMKEAENI